MAENKMKEVAKLLGVELEEEFKIYGWDGLFKITELGLERYVKGRSWMMDHVMLIDLIKDTAKIIKLPKPILDDVEKKYLSSIIKPLRNRIAWVRKFESPNNENLEYIKIAYRDDFRINALIFPDFRAGKMYRGMEINKPYTLKELGL